MYDELVKKLTLDKVGIDDFVDELGNILTKGSFLVEDLMVPLDPYGVNLPDYALFGHFRQVDHYMRKVFHINQVRDHIMYITGVEKNKSKLPYRFLNPIYVSYWEDNKIGYLVQIIKNSFSHDY